MLEYLDGNEICSTFASAFENERGLTKGIV